VCEDVLCVVCVERVVLCVYGMLRGKYQMCSAYCEEVLCVFCVCVVVEYAYKIHIRVTSIRYEPLLRRQRINNQH
jgi:hypothetical protein